MPYNRISPTGSYPRERSEDKGCLILFGILFVFGVALKLTIIGVFLYLIYLAIMRFS